MRDDEKDTVPTGNEWTGVAIDIGSTVVKVAKLDAAGRLVEQSFYPRDFDSGIAAQVETLLDGLRIPSGDDGVRICSSANGGLRVGIVCLTKHFSGSEFRNQVLLAGANPLFVRDFDDDKGDNPCVDILLVGGGIDCREADPLEQRLRCFGVDGYRFGSLLYCGNRYLAQLFLQRFPQAVVVPNPLADTLFSRRTTVFEAVSRAYLDDLVHKEGISELRGSLSRGIRPTPEVVNRGFQRAVMNKTSISVIGACILIDVGGATTDFHYTVEIVRPESESKPSAGSSIARYVFPDLGIVASRDSASLQIRTHPRLHDFLSAVLGDDVLDTYRALREGEFVLSPELLAYACIFIGLDRFAQGRGPGLPAADLAKVAQVFLTGGAVQDLSTEVVGRVFGLFLPVGSSTPTIFVDSRYQFWVDGIACGDESSS